MNFFNSYDSLAGSDVPGSLDTAPKLTDPYGYGDVGDEELQALLDEATLGDASYNDPGLQPDPLNPQVLPDEGTVPPWLAGIFGPPLPPLLPPVGRAGAFSTAEIRAMRQESIDRSNRAEARAIENQATSAGRFAITNARAAAAAGRAEEAAGRAKTRFKMAVDDYTSDQGRAQLGKAPASLAVPAAKKIPTMSWAQAIRLLPQDALRQLMSAWSGGGGGIGALSSQQWNTLIATTGVFDSVPQLEAALHNAWLAGGPRTAPGAQPRGVRMPALSKPPTIYQPRQRFNFK